MMRRSERRFTLTTRSLRAPTSWRSSAVFSSLSLLSGRAIRASRRLFVVVVVVEFQVVVVEIVKLRRVRGLLEMEHRPLPAERGCPQSTVGIDGDRMSECGKKGCVVVRVGVTPAIGEIDIAFGGGVRTPHGFFVARHHRLGQTTGCAAAAEDEAIRREVGDAKMTRERRHDEIRRAGDEARLDSGGAIGFDQFNGARKQVANEDAIAIFLAEREQAVARYALERFEQDGVQQAAVALLGDIQTRDSRGESEQVRDASGPFADVGESENGGMHEVKIDQGAVEIVEGGTALRGLGGVRVGRFLMSIN